MDFPPLEDMKKSGEILSKGFKTILPLVAEGFSPKNIDKTFRDFILDYECIPAFLGFDGFPNTCCISVNDQVVHCIPTDTPFKNGDIVSIDCGVVYNGAITDACRTVVVGDYKHKKHKKLVDTTQQCLDDAIALVKDGVNIGDISYTIQKIAEIAGFNASRHFTGHTISYELHLPPWIPNFGVKGRGVKLHKGMFIAIEPVIFEGHWNIKQQSQWNITSYDGKMSAHIEDTLYIDENEPIILTR